MKATGQGKGGRRGIRSGRGNLQRQESSGTASQPQSQPIRVTEISLETQQSSNPSQEPLQIGQTSSEPLQRTSPGTESSRNLEESIHPSPEVETVSGISKMRGRGKYKSKTVDIKTKYGGKLDCINITLLIIQTMKDWLIDLRMLSWRTGNTLLSILAVRNSRLLARETKKNREKQITKHSCGTRSFAEVEESTRNPESGEKDTPDKIWEIQHTRKNANGERVWSDPQSQQIHVQLQQLVVEQQSDEIEHPMTNDEILASILGERSGYVRGKGYGKRPPKKAQLQQANIEASVSSVMESIHQEMQADMDQKLQQEREQMEADLKRKMEEDLQKKMEEEREHMKGEVDKMIQEQMVAIMTRMQQGYDS